MSEQVLWRGIVVDVNELEQLRKDAERWRKLLANHHTVTVLIATEHNTATYSGKRLTDMVDALT